MSRSGELFLYYGEILIPFDATNIHYEGELVIIFGRSETGYLRGDRGM
ncbi:MAG: hypothetical protein PQJ59_18695 [Spirochaetales bacterium]|nr:hypothetical protein [Spirochaetales bacterium]